MSISATPTGRIPMASSRTPTMRQADFSPSILYAACRAPSRAGGLQQRFISRLLTRFAFRWPTIIDAPHYCRILPIVGWSLPAFTRRALHIIRAAPACPAACMPTPPLGHDISLFRPRRARSRLLPSAFSTIRAQILFESAIISLSNAEHSHFRHAADAGVTHAKNFLLARIESPAAMMLVFCHHHQAAHSHAYII